MTKITAKQNEYLLLLKEGPQTTRELSEEIGTSMSAAANILRNLRGKKLVTTRKICKGREQANVHSLTKPYSEMVLEISANAITVPIQEEEILYAAILRNGTLVGQRLTNQYQKLYPHRTEKSISNIVMTARRRRLCL